MNAEVDVKVKVLDGPDAGYSFEDKREVMMYYPINDGYVHPITVAYKFMTPSMYQEMAQTGYTISNNDTLGVVGADVPRVDVVIDLLKSMRSKAEPIQLPDNGFGTLIKNVPCDSSFDTLISNAIQILEQISG